jgi:NAD(P)H dehydrogenase (quinone)
MDSATVAVTGSTGRLGGRVAALLDAAGVAQRLVVRDPARAPALAGGVAVAAYDDATAVRSALTGVPTVFMVSASEHPDRVGQHRCFIDAAVAAGVSHLVYTSFSGAAPDATFTLARDHWATEEHIRASGLTFTILRDNLYADFMPHLADEHGVIRGPAGEGRVAAVAIDDVADVASAVLRDPAVHRDRVYELTGPEALSLRQAAEVLTRAGNREFRYEPESVEEAYLSRAGYGAPRWQLDAWVSTYTAIAAGELERVTDDVRLVTGHPARDLRHVL